ncbi:MAG: FG-GAP-like repeat-containing protein, partial [Limisphaerales bacterium]
YRNAGGGDFTDASEALPPASGDFHGCAWGDYNNDGWLDLFVANRNGKNNLLYRNQADGSFVLVAEGVVVADGGDSVGAAWADYDKDGFLDLFVTDLYGQNRLYHNEGGTSFTKITEGPMVNQTLNGVGCAWGDYNNDGYPDLFIANGGGNNNSLYRNNGNGGFTPVTEGAIVSDGGFSVGAAWADYDHDGDLDLFVANRQGPNFLYGNQGDGTFTRILIEPFASATGESNGCGWADYDNDGHLDLFGANYGSQNSFLYRNNGDGSFTPVTTEGPVESTTAAIGIGWADFDGNGFPDLAVANFGGISSLYRNSGNQNHWLAVRIRPGGQPFFGTRIRIKTVENGVERWQLREITSGDGWGGNDHTALFGLGSVATVAVVRIDWPNGSISELLNQATRQIIEVSQTQPPNITQFPESQSIPVGGAATLSVEAIGGDLTYEWFFNGSPIPDATSANLELTRVTPEQAGTYGVLVKNSAGSASATAVLDVVGELPGGTVYFSNQFTAADIDAPVTDLDGVTRLTGDTHLAQLWAGLTAESLAPAGAAVPFHTDARSGYWQAGVRTLSGIAPGEVAFVQVKVWEAAKGPSFVAAAAAGGRIGQSVVLQVVTGGDGTPPSLPANLVGLTPFKVVAELTPPIVSITSPMTGITQDNRVTLAGTISDNVGVASARWQWNDQPARDLHLMDGQFSVPGLELIRGRNLFRVTATDLSGNEAVADVTVTWEPARTLIVQDADPVQEGQRARTRLALASDGSVAGITFLLRYDPELLRDPKLDWSHAVRGAVAQVNLETPGVLRATLSMPGGRIAPGSQVLATIDFRSRSVPERTVSNVTPEVLDAADAQGNPLDAGTDTQAGTVVVLPRLIIGDNNGNDRLDIGDATVVQRFLAQLDEIRPWDVAANDLNASSALDSGDVIKVLRTVVRLDPQPTLPARSLTISANRHSNTGVTEAALSESSPDAAPAPSAGARLVVDKRVAAPGDAITVQVQLDGVSGAVAGARFTLNYPAHALRLVDSSSCRPGPMVPQDALVLWNVGTNSDTPDGTASGAFSSSTQWTLANGVLAEFTLQVQTGAANQSWPLELTGVEMTSDDGMEILTMMDQRTELNSAPALARTVEMTSEGARITLAVEPGASYTLETSDDLRNWRAYQTIIATGDEWQFTDPEGLTVNARFYRVRLNP